jgi:hypothetical protein
MLQVTPLRLLFLSILMGGLESVSATDKTARPKSQYHQRTDLTSDLLNLLVEIEAKLKQGKSDQNISHIAALTLHKIIAKNCSQAAHGLYNSLTSYKAHPSLKKTLHALLFNHQNSEKIITLDRIPEELVKNEQFCSRLKQTLSGTKMVVDEKKDPAYKSLQELHTQLHYYKWLKALDLSRKAFNPNRFYGEPLKGLKENLQFLISSMIYGYERFEKYSVPHNLPNNLVNSTYL